LIRDKLNTVIASQEEIPAVPSSTGKPPPGGGGGPTGNFSAQKEPPSPSGVDQDPLAKKEKEKVAAGALNQPPAPAKPVV
jgi:hypothetical protein